MKPRALLLLAAALGAWDANRAARAAETPASGSSAASPSGPAPAASSAAATRGERDAAKLRADYDRLRDELYRSRARAQLVEQGMYASKLGARLRWKGSPAFILHRVEIRIDGQTVWDSGDKPLVDERIEVAERPVKPGKHSLTIHLQVRPGKKADKETAELGYESEQTFVINVPDHRRLNAEVTADDRGDLPEYEPRLGIELASEKGD